LKYRVYFISLLTLIALTVFVFFNLNLKNVSATIQVTTDKSTYYLGQTITFTVTGATPSGKVAFQLDGPKGTVWVDEGTADSNGKVTKSINIPSNWDTGDYTITVKDQSSGQSDTHTFKILSPPSVSSISLSANTTEINYGGAVKFTALVKDQYGNVMGGVNVKLYINGTLEASKYTGSDGVANFTVTFNRGGIFQVYAKAGIKQSNTIYITVIKPPSTVTTVAISANATMIDQYGTVRFTVTVLDQFSDPMPNITVYLYVNDTLNTYGATNTDGLAVFDVTFTNTGKFYIYAVANNTISETLWINVKLYIPPSKVTSITLETDKDKVSVGENATLTATVYDQFNKPMPNVTVTLYVDNSFYSTNKTDSNGKACFKIAFYKTGVHIFFAKADTKRSNDITITVTPPPQIVTTVLLSADKNIVELGGKVKFIVVVLDQYGKTIANKNVTLYLNDEIYETKPTSTYGKVTFTVTFEREGVYTVYAKADNIQSNTVSVEVKPPPPSPLIPMMYILLGIFIVMAILLAVIFVKIWRERRF